MTTFEIISADCPLCRATLTTLRSAIKKRGCGCKVVEHRCSGDECTEITCPACGKKSLALIPKDQCQYFYKCPHCNERLKPKGEDCCVFCSYGDRPCGLPKA